MTVIAGTSSHKSIRGLERRGCEARWWSSFGAISLPSDNCVGAVRCKHLYCPITRPALRRESLFTRRLILVPFCTVDYFNYWFILYIGNRSCNASHRTVPNSDFRIPTCIHTIYIYIFFSSSSGINFFRWYYHACSYSRAVTPKAEEARDPGSIVLSRL